MHVFTQEAGNVAIMQAYQELAETIKPDFIVVTGDFRHLGKGTTFENGIVQLEKILSIFGVEKQNVFLIPGNHDVGPVADSDARTTLVKDIHENIGKDYQYYAKYKDKLLESFSEYRNMVSQFYKDILDNRDSRIAKCENIYHSCWNNMLNIVCMNTALVSDGNEDHKEIFDADSLFGLIDSSAFQRSLPTILLGHHSPNDFYESQSVYLQTFLRRTNASAYLHGDVHKLNIHDAIGSILVQEKIPSIACGKSIPESSDDYSDVSFIRYEWENDMVTVHPYMYGAFGGVFQFKESDIYNTEKGKFSFPMRRASAREHTAKTMTKQFGAVVPFVNDEEFIGRDAEIEDLQRLLQHPNAKIWLQAPGGIGKSTAARRLYHIMSGEFDRLIYVNYDTSLEESFAASVTRSFYDPYETLPENADSSVRYRKIVEQLQNCGGRTLIIIDNVAGDSRTTAALHSFSGISATIIVTARTKSAGGYVDYNLESLNDESQKSVFLYHLGETCVESSVLLQLLERCHNNTLLIELTAKAAKRRGCQKLLEALERGGFENEDTPVSSIEGRRGPIADHLRQLYSIAELDSESQRVLRCFALMPSGSVDDNVANWFGTDRRMLFDLSDMAWLKNMDGLFEMHPLIRETILLDRESFPQDTEAAFHAYLRNNYDDYFYFALDYPLRARRIAIATCFLLRISDTIDYAEACHNLAIELQEHRLYQAAEYLMQVSLRIKESKLGKNDPLTASAYHNLAMLYQGWNRPGDIDEAEKLHLKNLKIKKRKLDRNHPDLATSYNNLALLYQKREKKGDWDKAEELYIKALRIRESALEVDYLAVANSCNNLAHFYKCRNKKDDWDKAEKYYLKALRLQESILDGDHAAIPITYNNLATLYMERNLDGDWDRAEELYIKAITIGEKKLGNGHPDVAIAYCNLASLYRERNSPGDWDNAEVLVVGAVHILETVLGKDHPDTASAYINLASLYMDNNLKKDLNKAERFLLMAKTVFERVYGVKHPNTIKVYQRLMILYGDRKQLGDRERPLEYFYKSNTKKQLRELSLLK